MHPLSPLTVSHDGFAFNIRTGESYTLNPSAQIVVHRLQSGETQSQIVQAIATEFGIAQHRVERDVTDFCQQLQHLGLTGGQS